MNKYSFINTHTARVATSNDITLAYFVKQVYFINEKEILKIKTYSVKTNTTNTVI